MHEPYYTDRFEFLYKGLQLKDKVTLSFSPMYIIRRIVFALQALLFINFPFFQVQLFFLTNNLYMIYLGNVRPLKYRNDFRTEVFNEWIIQILCLHLVCFSGFVPDNNVNYQLGESFKYFAIFMILVDVSQMVKFMFRSLKLWNMKRTYKIYLKEKAARDEILEAIRKQTWLKDVEEEFDRIYPKSDVGNEKRR